MTYEFLITISEVFIFSIIMAAIIVAIFWYILFPIFDKIADEKGIRKVPYAVCAIILLWLFIVLNVSVIFMWIYRLLPSP